MGRHGTIAGRKAAQDSKRAAMFTKYGRQIIVAAKAGGDRAARRRDLWHGRLGRHGRAVLL